MLIAIVAYFVGLLLPLVVYYFHSRLRKPRTRTISRRYSTPEKCREIISNELSHNHQVNELSALQARAIPNKRLQIAFGIDNAFSSTDEEYVAQFVREARAQVNLSPEMWMNVSGIAQSFVSDFIEENRGMDTGHSIQIAVTDMVQALCLKVVLMTMFHGELREDVTNHDLILLAGDINRSWMDSKRPSQNLHGSLEDGDNKILSFEENVDLKVHLAAVFTFSGECRENPLNWILPSFETLWRVVMRAFLEIRFLTGLEHPDWRQTMIAFAKTPTGKQFEMQCGRDAIGESLQEWASAKDLVMESLRIYPPTRRIHRAYRWDGSETEEIIEADIEACHLNEDIWGPDASVFNPDRWTSLGSERDAFMPFGCRPFECPAKPVFGPRMIGILIGALLDGLESSSSSETEQRTPFFSHGNGNWRLVTTTGGVPKDFAQKKRLSMDRDAYGDLYLIADE